MVGQNGKFNVGDKVYHTGYLCSGIVIKTLKIGKLEKRYFVRWKQPPLKNTSIYFCNQYLKLLDFKYHIIKANNKLPKEIIKKFRDEVKNRNPQRMSIFSYSGGKIIESS